MTTQSKTMRSFILLLALTLPCSQDVSAFSVSSNPSVRAASSLKESVSSSETQKEPQVLPETTTTVDAPPRALSVPTSWDELVNQAASAMKQAAAQGQTKQIVRVLLPRDSASGDFGTFLESAEALDDGKLASVSLVPPDESWQGGIMQLYRSAAPTATKILRKLTADTAAGGLPPRIVEDRSVDESGVDGVSFLQTDDGQVSCWLQPLQDNVDDIVRGASNNDRIVALLNPQWRLVDDALDAASKKEGLFGGLASFLGGKGGALKRLDEAGFVPVYTLEGYVCRGNNVRLLQTMDSDWSVFCERDDGESYIQVGSAPRRPTYQQVDEMLDNTDIGYKYARDMGMSPKI